jgi:hypothetical protein
MSGRVQVVGVDLPQIQLITEHRIAQRSRTGKIGDGRQQAAEAVEPRGRGEAYRGDVFIFRYAFSTRRGNMLNVARFD